MRLGRLLLYGLLNIILFACNSDDDYHEYKPVYADTRNNGPGLTEGSDPPSEEHKRNIQHVFKYYGVPFKLEGEKLLYKGNIELELLWNYTSKADDTAWLNTHSVPKKLLPLSCPILYR